jgi:hypothetical protein
MTGVMSGGLGYRRAAIGGQGTSGWTMSEPEVFVIKPEGKEFENNENEQMVNLLRRLDVSEQKPDPIGGADSLDSGLSALTALAAGPRELKPLKSRELKPREVKSQAPAPQEPLNSVPSPKLAPEPGGSATVAKEANNEATKQISVEAPKVEAVLSEVLRPTSKVVATMPPSRDDPCDAYDDSYEASWSGETEEPAPDDQDAQDPGVSDKRRLTALAAVIGLAVVSGAIGGALATARLGHHVEQSSGTGLTQSSGTDQTKTARVDNQAVEESIARIDSELASLKHVNDDQSTELYDRIDKVEKTLRAAPAAAASTAMPKETIARIDSELASLKQLNQEQSNKVNDRLDKFEKAQAEPAAKLARLSQAIERLRAAPAAFAAMPKETNDPAQPPAPVASAAMPKETIAPAQPPVPAPVASTATPRETTASIQPPAAALKPKPRPEPKPEAARLPTLDGWVLRDITNDGAVIEGRQGLFEVLAGDAMPGIGRVEAIKRQDGRWVVVTTKGLIVAR